MLLLPPSIDRGAGALRASSRYTGCTESVRQAIDVELHKVLFGPEVFQARGALEKFLNMLRLLVVRDDIVAAHGLVARHGACFLHVEGTMNLEFQCGGDSLHADNTAETCQGVP